MPLPVRPGLVVSPDCLVRGVSRAQAAAWPGGGELRRVGAELGDDGPGVDGADPGDLIQPLGQAQRGRALIGAAGGVPAAGQPAGGAGRRGARDGRQLLPDRLVQPGNLLVDRVDQPQVRADLKRVDVAEPAGQRGFQLLAGSLQPRVAERGQRRRAAFPGNQGVQEPAAAGAEQVGDHHRDLQQRVLQDLLHPVLVPCLVLGQPGPGAGQRPQVPDRLRRHERAAEHAPLVQLAVPYAVEPVALAPAGQVLDVAGVDQPHLQPGRLGQVITPVGRRRGGCGSGPFPATPGPNRTGTFQCIRLSSNVYVQAAGGFPPWMT